MPAITTIETLRLKNCEFKGSPGYVVSLHYRETQSGKETDEIDRERDRKVYKGLVDTWYPEVLDAGDRSDLAVI